jgi:hypothetical protein
VSEEKLPVPTREEHMINPRIERLTTIKPEPLFESIVGYSDVKRIFHLSLSSEKPVHLLLVGPPASAKTLFMVECMRLERSYFTLGSHSTKSGMIDYLFDKRYANEGSDGATEPDGGRHPSGNQVPKDA